MSNSTCSVASTMATPPAKRAGVGITASLKKKICQRKVDNTLSSLRLKTCIVLLFNSALFFVFIKYSVIVVLIYNSCLKYCL